MIKAKEKCLKSNEKKEESSVKESEYQSSAVATLQDKIKSISNNNSADVRICDVMETKTVILFDMVSIQKQSK